MERGADPRGAAKCLAGAGVEFEPLEPPPHAAHTSPATARSTAAARTLLASIRVQILIPTSTDDARGTTSVHGPGYSCSAVRPGNPVPLPWTGKAAARPVSRGAPLEAAAGDLSWLPPPAATATSRNRQGHAEETDRHPPLQRVHFPAPLFGHPCTSHGTGAVEGCHRLQTGALQAPAGCNSGDVDLPPPRPLWAWPRRVSPLAELPDAYERSSSCSTRQLRNSK